MAAIEVVLLLGLTVGAVEFPCATLLGIFGDTHNAGPEGVRRSTAPVSVAEELMGCQGSCNLPVTLFLYARGCCVCSLWRAMASPVPPYALVETLLPITVHEFVGALTQCRDPSIQAPDPLRVAHIGVMSPCPCSCFWGRRSWQQWLG